MSCSRAIVAINTNSITDSLPKFSPPYLASTSLFFNEFEEDNKFSFISSSFGQLPQNIFNDP